MSVKGRPKRRATTVRVPTGQELAAADRIEQIAAVRRRYAALAYARGHEAQSYMLQARAADLDAVVAEIRSDKPLSPETRQTMKELG